MTDTITTDQDAGTTDQETTDQEIAPAETAGTQCAYKSAKGNRCKLPAGHDTGENPTQHKMRLPSAPGLPGGFVKPVAEDVPEAEKITTVSRAGERSEDQRAFDADMAAAWHLWDEKGRAEKFEDMPHKRYLVESDAVDGVLALMRIAVGSGALAQNKKLHYRRASHVSGKIVIEYAVSNKPAPVATAPAELAPTAEEQAAAEESAAQIAAAGDQENPPETPETPEAGAADVPRQRRQRHH